MPPQMGVIRQTFRNFPSFLLLLMCYYFLGGFGFVVVLGLFNEDIRYSFSYRGEEIGLG